MSPSPSSMHIYQRAVDGGSNDSLSLIAKLIAPGESFLDLGMGTGGLGQFLSQYQINSADGVSLNPLEAAQAQTWYRHTRVADLDQVDLRDIFVGEQYDCIVCADVLEHLKSPERLLEQCRYLLKPEGRLLTSVPNAAYCGLLAELLLGEFKYRAEGLLDSTHLRFFTRTSLSRFFTENGWHAVSVQSTQRHLLESEFKVAIDQLPPSVARYLLASPDAMTYQFISVHQLNGAFDTSGNASFDNPSLPASPVQAHALFSAQLYLGQDNDYVEDRKVVTSGVVGLTNQSLVFEIPVNSLPYTALRLDPADRPGFIHMRSMSLALTDGQVIWAWQATRDGADPWLQSPQSQILMTAPWAMSADLLWTLFGDDPWVQLPLPNEVLQQLHSAGARLTVQASWPMSADYLAASATLQQLDTKFQIEQHKFEQEIAKLNTLLSFSNDQNDALKAREDSMQTQLFAELNQRNQESQRHQAELSDAVAKQQILQAHVQGLQLETRTWIAQTQQAQIELSQSQSHFEQLHQYVQRIEQSKLFRWTRPLANLKYKLRQRLSPPSQLSLAPIHQNLAEALHPAFPSTPVNIIVPVYKGLEDTRCCLESVLASSCKTPWHLVVINDCSPEPEVTQWLQAFALRDQRIELLENETNLGFVGTVNRGMALYPDRDVLLLNSDTEVANDWLDRIQQAAYSGPKIASVTPFSNNATICSYPRFCKANDLPPGFTTASLDALFSKHLTRQHVAVPTGVGFCMFIRRACLQDIGAFDEEHFGKGYGEENDFCIRAQNAGWVNLHTLDTFVRHAGGISFGDSKNERELNAMRTLAKLHPRYDSDVQTFIAQDPAQLARHVIDIARITAPHKPVILNVMHNRVGGTMRHLEEIGAHLSAQASFLRLSPSPGGVNLKLEGPCEAMDLYFAIPHQQDSLLQILKQLQVGHVHFHHLLGHDPFVFGLADMLGVPHDFTVHDYYSFCPQISLTDASHQYCGEQGLEQCHQCLKRNPAPGHVDIEIWRAPYANLLSKARYVISPSIDAGERILNYAPSAHVQVVPHAQLLLRQPETPSPQPSIRPPDKPLKIVVLGALSQIKGADVVEAVALLASKQKAPIEIHLLGYGYRQLRTQPHARLTVHGAYEDKDLPALLKWLQPDVVWFPALWPETYSYTLSASLEAGLPIVAPQLGAFAERLANRPWTWLCDWDLTPVQWLTFFEDILSKNFVTGLSNKPLAPRIPSPILGLDLDYRQQYLEGIPLPQAVSTEVLKSLTSAMRHSSHAQTNTSRQGRKITLRCLEFLKRSAVLSPLVRMVSLPFQRRVKSWLIR